MAAVFETQQRAIALLNAAIGHIAGKLGAIFVQREDLDPDTGSWVAKKSERHADRFAKYLFPTLPHAIGYFGFGEDVDLVCIGSNSAMRFWAFAGEALDNEDLPVNHQKSCCRIDLSKVARQYGLIQCTHLNIIYVQKPESFDTALGHRPFLLPLAAAKRDPHLGKAYDQQHLLTRMKTAAGAGPRVQRQRLQNDPDFCNGFLLFMDWAYSAGMISGDMGLMNAECLLYLWQKLYDQLFEKLAITSMTWESSDAALQHVMSICIGSIIAQEQGSTFRFLGSSTSKMSVGTPSGRDLAAQISPAATKHIRTAFAIAQASVRDNKSVICSPAQGFLNFCEHHPHQVVATFRCWVPSKFSSFSVFAREKPYELQKFHRDNDSALVIWPIKAPWSEDTITTREIIYLLGLKPGFDKKKIEALNADFKAKYKYDKDSYFVGLEVSRRLEHNNKVEGSVWEQQPSTSRLYQECPADLQMRSVKTHLLSAPSDDQLADLLEAQGFKHSGFIQPTGLSNLSLDTYSQGRKSPRSDGTYSSNSTGDLTFNMSGLNLAQMAGVTSSPRKPATSSFNDSPTSQTRLNPAMSETGFTELPYAASHFRNAPSSSAKGSSAAQVDTRSDMSNMSFANKSSAKKSPVALRSLLSTNEGKGSSASQAAALSPAMSDKSFTEIEINFAPNFSPPRPTRPTTEKFMDAQQVMARLKHDSKHAAIEYEVGYKDRFKSELQWKSLWEWQPTTEEEDFVPQHRMEQVRRKEDGYVVWNREKRINLT